MVPLTILFFFHLQFLQMEHKWAQAMHALPRYLLISCTAFLYSSPFHTIPLFLPIRSIPQDLLILSLPLLLLHPSARSTTYKSLIPPHPLPHPTPPLPLPPPFPLSIRPLNHLYYAFPSSPSPVPPLPLPPSFLPLSPPSLNPVHPPLTPPEISFGLSSPLDVR